MHEHNSFITLTYSNDHLKSNSLVKEDFKTFMKDLRREFPEKEIGLFACGEYGKKTKRPHFHALLFNLDFPDKIMLRKNKHGDILYTSKILDEIWGKNDPKQKPNEIGSVDFNSAAYVARYHTKSLVHGNDSEDLKPITFMSKKYAIGKRFIEKYHQEVFNSGYCIFQEQKFPIPRYYQKWYQKNFPDLYQKFVDNIRLPMIQSLNDKKTYQLNLQNEAINNFRDIGYYHNPISPRKIKERSILKKTLEILNAKGD